MIGVLAFVFLALHLPYLPASLEDLDSINFALGIRRFDVAHHQPHPPGYPVYVLIAKAIHAVVPTEVASLALISVLSGTLGVIALAALFRRLDGPAAPASWSVAAVGVAMTTPLYWFTAVRPLSDTAGLAAALAVQVMTLGATSARGLALAGFCAGLAAGVRSQVVWLTVPLLILQGLRAQGSGLKRGETSEAPSPQPLALALILFTAGLLVWFVPLVLVSGGPSAYWHALFDQGAEDLGNIRMLWTAHGARDVTEALYYAFVAPWAAWPVAVVGLTCASVGVLQLYRHQRRALIVLAAAFGPYLAFDLLFQETFTSRYALPLIAPMAYLAVAGLRLLPWDTGLAFAVAIAMFDAHIGGTSIAAYSRAKAPAFRLLDDMRAAAPSRAQPPVLALDRRESFDLRRPMKWIGDAMPAAAQVLPSPPQHEWLEAVKYWNGGGRAPVWFVVDPMRTSIDLVQHGEPSRYRWPLPYPVLLSGARPNEMDWYQVDRPEWYVGEGWALTPEAAGVAEADRRGPSIAPIEGWISVSALGGQMMIGGRNFSSTPATITVVEDTRGIFRIFPTIKADPGPFLRLYDLAHVEPPLAGDYFKVTVRASPGSQVAIEQFDAGVNHPVFGFGNGWHEQEFNPRTGRRWRWLSERGELQHLMTNPVVLHLEGEAPRTSFPRASRLIVRARGSVLYDGLLSSDFSLNIVIPSASYREVAEQSRQMTWERQPWAITLETDQVFSPADRNPRSGDRRHLGLRIFTCELRPSIPPIVP